MGKPFIMNTRDSSPCKDCKERHTACSDHCEKYKDWKAEIEIIKQAKREYDKLPFSKIT